ncbi:MAG: MaoC family dehydratase [Alphaproteobacteria bacterium]|nr:MaoC family dehydratase [Alphaproteobacteria bacterium]
MISQFGDLTLDMEPLHTDPEWCRTNSPYAVPIAYGFLTLSLLTHFLHDATRDAFKGTHLADGYPINYGFDKVRFVEPVRVGDAIRASFESRSAVDRSEGRTLLTVGATVEIRDRSKPALTADWLFMWVPAQSVGC